MRLDFKSRRIFLAWFLAKNLLLVAVWLYNLSKKKIAG